jgi:hypothetical protein
MPIVFVVDGFRFLVNVLDHAPPHVHVLKSGAKAKLRLDTLAEMKGATMRASDISKAQEILRGRLSEAWAAWRHYHG